MQSNIIVFFFFSALLAMSFTLAYISYSYQQQLERNIQGTLKMMLSDIKHKHLYTKLAYEKMSFFEEDAQKDMFAHLFADLKIEVSSELDEDDDERIHSFTKLTNGRYLSISCSRERIEEEVVLFTLKTLGVFILVFLVLVTVFTLYVKRQFRWLSCLIEFCNFYQTDRNTPLKCNGTHESTNLHKAILSLIQSNDNLCTQKQELFKEAAHELKSPIAVLKARLSLYEKDDNSDKKLFVKQSREDISRITSRLKELLFLKSIEWDMQLLRENVNMQENCEMMQEAFAPILQKKNVKVDSQWEESFVIHTYKDALQKVLQAVFENIFIHTKKDSTIFVKAKPNEIFIQNEIGDKEDIPLFSSHIGTKMIERLSEKLSYEYKTSADDTYFYTHLIFHSIEEEGGCEI